MVDAVRMSVNLCLHCANSKEERGGVNGKCGLKWSDENICLFYPLSISHWIIGG